MVSMASLVADYGTSSSDSESDNHETEDVSSSENKNEAPSAKLPKPDFAGSSTKNSVFSNPFVEAENAKKAILEKHVKMVPTKDKVEMINGKKICWNYRKGRCHFGHNCTFAHDTDLQTNKKDKDSDAQVPAPTDSCVNHSKVLQVTGSYAGIEENTTVDTESKWENQTVTRKKRPGLTPGIVPSKKVMKFYNKTKDTK